VSFRTTRWSVVLAAGGTDGRRALEELCRDYWYPLYAVARRRGHDAHAAEDRVQAFFAHLLEHEVLAAADPERGRFRTFLRTCFENHMNRERERATAAKRGGGRPAIPLDGAEERYAREPADATDPFVRAWALAVLRTSLAALRREYAERGSEEEFDALKETLTAPGEPYAAIAARLGRSVGAVKVAAHRLRRRYRDAVRAAIAETVANEGEIEEEIGLLFRAL